MLSKVKMILQKFFHFFRHFSRKKSPMICFDGFAHMFVCGVFAHTHTHTHRINILRNQVFFRMMDIFRSSSTSTGQTFKSLTAIFFFFEFKFHSSPSISQYWWWALAKKTNKWMIKRETKIKPSFLLLFCFDHGSFKNDNGGIK